MRDTERRVSRRILTVALACLIACSGQPYRRAPIEGQVVDADTRQPIEGATVILGTIAHCARGMEGYSVEVQPEVSRTDGHGHFRIGQPFYPAPPGCSSWGWDDALHLLAPGYIDDSLYHNTYMVGENDFAVVGLLPAELHRVHYLAELEVISRGAQTLTSEGAQRRTLLRDALNGVVGVPTRSLDARGVFVRDPSASFDQIAATRLTHHRLPQLRTLILAHDRNSGAIRAWTTSGAATSVPRFVSGWGIVGAGEESVPGYVVNNAPTGDSRASLLYFQKNGTIYSPHEEDWVARSRDQAPLLRVH